MVTFIGKSAHTHLTWTSKDGSAGIFKNGAVIADTTDFASRIARTWISVVAEPSINFFGNLIGQGPMLQLVEHQPCKQTSVDGIRGSKLKVDLVM